MMKNISVIFLFSLLSTQALAQQPFSPTGAVWHYDFNFLTGGGFDRLEYTGDTLINGKLCKKIDGVHNVFTIPNNSSHTSYNLATNYIYQNGDTVFYLFNNSFFVLFNFGAVAGDEWIIADQGAYGSCDSISNLHVDSSGTENINGQILRWISVRPGSHSPYGIYGKIYERIGPIDNSLFPDHNNCDSSIIIDFAVYFFHCYEDSSFALYNRQTNDCEFWLSLGLDKTSFKNKLNIFPNPLSEKATIITDMEMQNARLKIYNLQGSLVMEKGIQGPNTLVDFTDFEEGFYFIQLCTQEAVFVKKFLVVKDSNN